MKNWKTTIVGALTAGLTAAAGNYQVIAGDPAAKMNWAAIIGGFAMAAFGYFAQDAQKSTPPPQV